ncbi:MAG: beta-eliminating lyase-related protein [Candidatus Devosia symbiotica]|nr:beta-eliminating lyase-related protein [Candidatus Devosia symbiotica]
MRQSGILAAAELYALDHNIGRLADDHRQAKRLADGLGQFPALTVTVPDTNIVFVGAAADIALAFGADLATCGIGIIDIYSQQR